MSFEIEGRSKLSSSSKKRLLKFEVEDCHHGVDFLECFVLPERQFYRISVRVIADLNCPGEKLEVRLIRKPNEVLASGEGEDLEFGGVLEKCDQIAVEVTTCLVKRREVEFEIRIRQDPERFDQIQLLEELTAFDQGVNTENRVMWHPFAPPTRPARPLPPTAKQFPDADHFYLWYSNVFPWLQNQSDSCPGNPPAIQAIPKQRFSPQVIQSLKLPGVPGDVQAHTFGYDNFGSLPASIFFYLGLRLPKAAPENDDNSAIDLTRTSPENTIFARGVEDRGPEALLKKKYMFALTTQLLQFYTEKVDLMLETIYTRIVIDAEPVLSAFQEEVINFFLSIHIGVDPEGYPDFVLEYFRTFIDVASFADPARPKTPSFPSRDEQMLFGFNTAPRVKEYFARRAEAVITRDGGDLRSGDTTTLVYWWTLSGLPTESLVIESVHNMNAFNQFAHIMYLMIADKAWKENVPGGNQFPFVAVGPNPPSSLPGYVPVDPETYPLAPNPPLLAYPPPALQPGEAVVPTFSPAGQAAQTALNYGPQCFFGRMANAADDTERLNIVREAYRMLVPVGVSFSSVRNDVTDEEVQSRTVHKAVMIVQEGNTDFGALPSEVPKFFQFNPARYSAFQTDLTTFNPNFPPAAVTELIRPEQGFRISEVDCQTVVDRTNDKVQAVLPNAVPGQPNDAYLSFGLGLRRCAGEVFVYLVTQKLIQRFAGLEFEFRTFRQDPEDPYTGFVTQPDGTQEKRPYVPLAPFEVQPDNIYVRKTWEF